MNLELRIPAVGGLRRHRGHGPAGNPLEVLVRPEKSHQLTYLHRDQLDRAGLQQAWIKLLWPVAWTQIAHLTFRDETITLSQAWRVLKRFFRKVSRTLNGRCLLSWYACPESQSLRGAVHFSVLMTGIAPGLAGRVEKLWSDRWGDNPWVRPFDEQQRIAGLTYVTKEIATWADPEVGGPVFAGRTRSSSVVARKKQGHRKRRGVGAFPFCLNGEQRDLVLMALSVARLESRTPQVKPASLFLFMANQFAAQRFLSVFQRFALYRDQIDGSLEALAKPGVPPDCLEASLTRLAANPPTPPPEPHQSLRVVLPTKRDMNPLGGYESNTRWEDFNFALRLAQRMSPRMTLEQALAWIALDFLMWNVDLGRRLPDGRHATDFLAHHLSRLATNQDAHLPRRNMEPEP